MRPASTQCFHAPCIDVLVSASLTQTGGAQAQFTVNGDAVAIYGTVSPKQANYTVTVDGHTQGFGVGSNGSVSSLHVGVRTQRFPYGAR